MKKTISFEVPVLNAITGKTSMRTLNFELQEETNPQLSSEEYLLPIKSSQVGLIYNQLKEILDVKFTPKVFDHKNSIIAWMRGD